MSSSPTTTNPPNRAPEASSRKEQIYQTAGRLFSEVGYHATSMRDLARAMGVQGGSLYAHIESKEELLFEIVNRATEEFLAALLPVAAQKQAAPAHLQAVLQAHLAVMSRNLDWATVFFHEWKHLSQQKQLLVKAGRDQVEGIYRQILEQGVGEGHFRQDLDIKLAAILCLSSVNWIYHWFRPDGRLSGDEVAAQFAHMLIGGFKN
jgi:TetR/AcrR family transcriptional regulator, cholesterol catabolism regulator